MVESLILFFVFCIIVGSFAYIRPTPKQRHQSAIRMQAISAGLRIKQKSIDDLSVTGRVNQYKKEVMTYQLLAPMNKKIKSDFTVQRTTGENSLHLPKGWVWTKSSDDSDVIKFLQEQLELLDPDFEYLQIDSKSICIAWNEKGDRIAEVHALLSQYMHFFLKH